ncbi:ferredoxin--NAD(+) reductase [Methylobacterium durans]|uniref:ferredoxin--NAD(+) reductase n=1 Tax=Methylobacterium durans TaxID=2202825 RepID=UPI002AFF0B17|nr:ferredoxin--NAD(+) reductase [Methylobacterium durans]MEA1830534.1 ferredoxin--NAD(+) reductase [Methylobacterium durans]
MSARCSLVVNGKSVRVSTGDTPLEAALAEGMIAPTQGVHGAGAPGQAAAPAARRLPGRGHRPDMAKLPLPRPQPAIVLPETRAAAPVKRTGSITDVRALSPHAIEVVVTVTRRLPLEPGHQVVLAVEGLEPLTLCPTLRVDGSAELNELVFHLPHDPDAPGLAASLAVGTAAKIRGPVGRAQYRPGGGRLILVSDGTGFAPVWSVARAARYVEPARDMAVLVGARDPLDLYMRPALDWLRATGIGRITLVADRSRQRPPDVRPGPLTAHVPPLRTTDVVHVAGSASTVGAVEVLAAAAGARCYPLLVPET